MKGGVIALFTTGSLSFTVFSCAVTVVCSNRSAADLPTRQSHATMATTKTSQYGAQWVCDGGVFVAGEEAGVELMPNDLRVQSEGTGSIF